MQVLGERGDRRAEIRQPRAGRITWHRQADLGTLRGWLSDGSAHSVSFIIGREVQPRVGESVEICDAAGRRRYGRVIRTAEYSPRLALVAARVR